MIKLIHNVHDHTSIDLVTVFTSQRDGQTRTVVWGSVHIDFFNDGADRVHDALLVGDVDCVLLTQAEHDMLTQAGIAAIEKAEPPAEVAERTE